MTWRPRCEARSTTASTSPAGWTTCARVAGRSSPRRRPPPASQTLRIRPAPAQEIHSFERDLDGITTATPSRRVLVVDDEPNIVDIVSMALRFNGTTTSSAGTGAEALSQVGDFKPDL